MSAARSPADGEEALEPMLAGQLTADEQAVRDWAHGFAAEYVRPAAAELDRDRAVPHQVLGAAHQAGLTTFAIPQEFGGGGQTGALPATLIAEEMSWGCVGVYSYIEGLNMFVSAVREAGTAQQQEQWLSGLCGPAPQFASFACTEPEAGSDVAGLRTTARRASGGWLLSGEKTFITNASMAAALIVVARLEGTSGHDGLSLFIVDGQASGISYGPRARTMGWRASCNCPVHLDDVFVPDGQVLGELGHGFGAVVRTFELSRIEVAAASLGIARAALEYARDYARSRQAFGRPISHFQGLSFPLADAVTRLRAARLLTWSAARAADAGQPIDSAAAMAKLFASEAAVEITGLAMQVLGGHGYVEDHPVEKWLRDARLETIEEGTSQIQRLIIARALFSGDLSLA
jgi:alkylation response protein AidB-like acyl-CoA dehydrogenase